MADVAGYGWNVVGGTIALDIPGCVPLVMALDLVLHRARNAADSAYVFWAALGPDPDGAWAPEAILAGSVTIL